MSQVGKEMSTTTSVKSKAKSSGIYRRRAAGKKTSNALFREISDLNLGDLPSTYTPRETMEALRALFELHLRAAAVLWPLIQQSGPVSKQRS